MANFKAAVTHFSAADDASMSVPLGALPIATGDTVLLVWRADPGASLPATPAGWQLLVEKLPFQAPSQAPHRVVNVYRRTATGPMSDLSVPLTGWWLECAVLVLTLAAGEELGGWTTGLRRTVALNDAVALRDDSPAGLSFLLTTFDTYGIA